MRSASETVNIRFQAEMAQLKAELEKLPGITDKQAAAVYRTWNRRMKEADREAKKAAKAALDATKRQQLAYEGLKQTASNLGGSIGNAAGAIDNMVSSSKALGAALGPTGMLIGAATVGLGALAAAGTAAAYSLHGIVDSADEAIDRLREIEGTEPISQAALVAIDDYNASTLRLESATLQLKVALAEDLAPAFATIVDLLALTIEGGTTLYRTLQDVSEAATGAGIGANLLEGAVYGLLGPTAGMAFEFANWSGAAKALGDAISDLRPELRDTAKDTDALAAAASGAIAEWDALMASMGVDPTEHRIKQQQDALIRTFELTKQARLATGEWSELEAKAAETNLGIQLRAIRQREEAAVAEAAQREAEREAREAERQHAEWQRQQAKDEADRAKSEEARIRARAEAEAMLYTLRDDAEERAWAAAEAREAKIDALARAGVDEATIERLRAESLAQYNRDVAQAQEARAEAQRALAAAERAAHLAQVDAGVTALQMMQDMGGEVDRYALAEAEIRQEYEHRLEAIEELRRAGLDASSVAQLNLQAELDLQRQLAEIEKERADNWRQAGERAQELAVEIGRVVSQIGGAVGPLLDTVAMATDLRIDRLQSEYEAMVRNHEQAMASARAELDAELEAGRISQEEHEAKIAHLDAFDEAQQALHEQQKASMEEAALKAHKVAQAAAITEIAIQALINASALTPFYAFAGPAAPFIAAGIAATQAGIAIAAVKATPPPEFPMGGIVGDRLTTADHVLVGVRPDEGIASPRGLAAIGGRDGLEAINQGQTPFGGTVQLQIDRRVIGEAVIDATGRSRLRPVSGRIVGRAPVYGRG